MANKKRSKRYQEAAKLVQAEKRYTPDEAFALMDKFPKAKFNETVNAAVKLNIDPRKADQNLRGALSLPHGIGKTLRVICFAEGDDADKAKNAGAMEVGSEELAKKIEGGWMDFDVAIAHPNQMRHVGRLGKVLGPQGKMPTPKAGTVTPDVETAVREFCAGKVEFRTDPAGNIHMPIGKRSFDNDKLTGNLRHLVAHLKTMKPSAVKGIYIQGVSVAATMSPGIQVAVD